MSLDPMAWLAQAAADTKPEPVRRRVSEDTDEASRWAWTNTAACRHADPDIFYPVENEPYDTATLDAARRICNACPVFAACHDHALHNESDGIWAGTAPTERRRLRRTLHIVDPAALGRDEVHDEAVGITPPLWEIDTGRSAREAAAAAGVTPRTIFRHRAARRSTP